MTFDRKKSVDDLVACYNQLKDSIKLYHAGRTDQYRNAAVQMRILIFDKRNSLLPRLFPDIELHPLICYEEDQGFEKEFGYSRIEKTVFRVPAHIDFDGKGGAVVSNLFNEQGERIAIDEWLAQPLFNKNITLFDFVRSVSDKESAHSDKFYNDVLIQTKSAKLASIESHKAFIIAIGEYITRVIVFQLSVDWYQRGYVLAEDENFEEAIQAYDKP